MDNVDNNWRKKVGNEYKSDNSPLSTHGHKQCVELAEWFKDIKVDHIFASPFDRTLDTATRMIGDRGISIKPEAGFLEALYLCCKPPGVRPWNILKETYPLIDETYDPVVNPWKEGFKDEGPGDDACTDRIKDAIERILNKYEGKGKWSYVGQATVSKLVEMKNGKYEALYIAGHAHLSDKRNLRAW
uniref:Uncharacterized protein n=1 Tax=Panagrolaimus sp. PS1159 TaxID=55785 RepID=A0AC35G2L9_9BILA